MAVESGLKVGDLKPKSPAENSARMNQLGERFAVSVAQEKPNSGQEVQERIDILKQNLSASKGAVSEPAIQEKIVPTPVGNGTIVDATAKKVLAKEALISGGLFLRQV